MTTRDTTVSVRVTVPGWELGLSVETAPPYRLLITQGQGPQPGYWAMEDDDGWDGRPFREDELRGAALQEFFKARRGRPWPAREPVHLVKTLSRFAQVALDTCTNQPRDLALGLYPRLRFNAYQLLRDDLSGRLAQLRGACPGAFVLLATLTRLRRSAEPAQVLRRNLVAGRKLNHALRDVLPRLESVDGGVLETWLSLVRRAPVSLRPTGVLGPPPRGIVLDDVPSHATARRCWYDIITWLGDVLSSRPPHPAHASIGEFISKHGIVVRRWLNLHDRDVRDFVAFVEQSGRVVGRSVNPTAVLEEFGLYCGPLDPFPCAPLPPLDSGGAHLEHVADRRTLLQLGRSFHNCAGKYALKVRLGAAAIYVGTLVGERVMVEVTGDQDEWRCGQVRGFANRLPSADEQSIVNHWIDSTQPKALAQSPVVFGSARVAPVDSGSHGAR